MTMIVVNIYHRGNFQGPLTKLTETFILKWMARAVCLDKTVEMNRMKVRTIAFLGTNVCYHTVGQSLYYYIIQFSSSKPGKFEVDRMSHSKVMGIQGPPTPPRRKRCILQKAAKIESTTSREMLGNLQGDRRLDNARTKRD